MKLKHIIIISLSLFPLAGFSQSETFIIQGKVNHQHDGKYVKIYYEDSQTKKVDSVVVKKGRFELKGGLTVPTVGKLSFDGEDTGDYTDLFLSEGTIRVSTKDSLLYADISGTEMTEIHERLAKQLRPANRKMIQDFTAIKAMPEGEEKKAYITDLLTRLGEYNQHRRETIHQFVIDNPTSYVSLYYLDKTAQGQTANYETTYPYYEKLSPALKETAVGKQLNERLLKAKGELTDQPYKDFVSTTPEGDQLSLKEVLGKHKYTLVDFWASWCGPCRKENPHVIRTYNAFREKGFTVLSVSLDNDATRWKNAIEQDGMPWYHVSSLQGWKEPAAALYNVRAIPQNVLIDNQGKIVATNLRGETLYKKIEELVK
jgi:thiol-disulfide isomerase/thioredoxin